MANLYTEINSRGKMNNFVATTQESRGLRPDSRPVSFV